MWAACGTSRTHAAPCTSLRTSSPASTPLSSPNSPCVPMWPTTPATARCGNTSWTLRSTSACARITGLARGCSKSSPWARAPRRCGASPGASTVARHRPQSSRAWSLPTAHWPSRTCRNLKANLTANCCIPAPTKVPSCSRTNACWWWARATRAATSRWMRCITRAVWICRCAGATTSCPNTCLASPPTRWVESARCRPGSNRRSTAWCCSGSPATPHALACPSPITRCTSRTPW